MSESNDQLQKEIEELKKRQSMTEISLRQLSDMLIDNKNLLSNSINDLKKRIDKLEKKQ